MSIDTRCLRCGQHAMCETCLEGVLREHRHLEDDPSAVTCGCGAGLFTVEAHESRLAGDADTCSARPSQPQPDI
jgi:hypothetical protein